MNKKKREKLKIAIDMIDSAYHIVDATMEEEQDGLDNMPESLEGSDRYEKMEDAVRELEEALDNLERAKEHIEEASA